MTSAQREALGLPRSREIPGSAKSRLARMRARHWRRRVGPLIDKARRAATPGWGSWHPILPHLITAAARGTQLNSYHVIMEVLPELQASPGALDRIFIKSPLTGQEVRISALAKWTTAPTTFLSINHQGQFPAVTLSFNLAPNIALGQAVTAIQAAEAELGKPPSLTGTFQGNAQAFQASLSSEPYLIAAALVVIYLILGMLYESYIHPLTILSTLPSAGVGALLMLMWFGFDFGVIALIGIILLIGIVKKNGIMIVDFAIAAERERGLSPLEAIREACLLTVDLPPRLAGCAEGQYNPAGSRNRD
jgi:multidrug efflux pump subunit AcrB